MPGAYRISVYNKDGSEELLQSSWGDFGIVVQSDRLLWNGASEASYAYVLFSNTNVIGYATTSNATVAEYPIGAEYVPEFGTTLTLYEVERDPYNITFSKDQLIIKCKDKTMEKDLQISFGGEKVRSIKLLLDQNKSCYQMFNEYKGTSIEDGTLEFNDTENVTNMSSMFYGCSNLTTIPQLNTSSATDMGYMFSNCKNLTTIPQLNTSSVTNMYHMFSYCQNLTTIPQLDTSSVISITEAFFNCYKLTNLTLLNIKVNLTIGSGTYYGHLLTVDSLVNTCKECIKQSDSRTLTVGSANLTKLSSVYVKFTDPSQTEIAVDSKGDVVVCESTDEGAMLISDYMTLKSWTLA